MKKILLFLFGLSLMAIGPVQAQNRTVTGKVTASEDGAPLPGVNVVVKGTSTGTVTDAEGNYRLDVPTGQNTLLFSFIGMSSQEVEIGNRAIVDAQMSSDMQQLGEVVVVGYGTQLKQDLTGNIASVSGAEIHGLPVNSFESALQGRTSGVFIEKASGKLGEGIKVRVRGASSISAGNQPLYVVDGIPITSDNQGITNNQPTNPLADLNFNDIEAIEILKDASAAAIYGSRASNGVVIITTKRGASGKTNIDVNYRFGKSSPTNKVGFLNAAEYRELYTEATLRLLGIDPVTATDQDKQDAQQFLEDELVDGFASDKVTDTNWEDLAFNDNAGYQQLDLTASGGTDKTKFYTGLSYSDQTGILINNEFKRLSGRLNLDQRVTDRLNFSVGLNLIRTRLDRVSNDNAFSTPLQMVALAPVQKAYLENGEPNPNTIYYNGLIQKKYAWDITVVHRALGTFNVNYELVPGLAFRSELGLDLLDQQEDNYYGRLTQDGAPGGLGTSRSTGVLNYTWNNFLTLDKKFGDKHNINAVAGMSFQQSDAENTSVQAKDFPSDDLSTIASAASPVNIFSNETSFAFTSYFARANLKLSDKYLIGLSGRIDGSSKFGQENRYGFFPSASVGWIISEESFLSESSLLSFLKFRASYGLTGNAPLANNAHLGTWTGANYTTTSGLTIATLPSPDLKWENTAQTNIGIDFGLFNDRLTGQLDYYVKNTTDLLLSRPLPAISGYTSIFENVGEMENKGIEVVLNSQNLIGAIRWNTSFNIAFNKNKITRLNSDADIIAGSGVNRARLGEPIGVFITRRYAGVDPANGDALYDDGEGGTTNDYNDAPDVVVGNPNPDFYGGLNNNLSYKGFDLGVFFQFVSGNDIYNTAGEYQSNNASGFVDNQTKDQMRRWRKPGDITDVPRAELVGSIGVESSSRYLSDGSYVRLKTVTLGYNLPREIIDRLKLRSTRIFISGQNLWTMTDYKGWDPEVSYNPGGQSTTNDNLIQGNDFYTAPQDRTFVVGINVGL